VFETVLVADRGLGARRVVRTCHRIGSRAVTVHTSP
jgi:acetyl/propionyl-CoA carboxylase alpha subunit